MLINDRFQVDQLRGEVTDRRTGTLNRVEPRLMKLLCLLAEHAEKPISRKFIIKEIWDDYPGGNEGLNQAISVLRKLLDDNQKRIIETFPKTGYCFHGTTTPRPVAPKRKSLKAAYYPAALFLLLIIALALVYYHNKGMSMAEKGRLDSQGAARDFQQDTAGHTDDQGKTAK